MHPGPEAPHRPAMERMPIVVGHDNWCRRGVVDVWCYGHAGEPLCPGDKAGRPVTDRRAVGPQLVGEEEPRDWRKAAYIAVERDRG